MEQIHALVSLMPLQACRSFHFSRGDVRTALIQNLSYHVPYLYEYTFAYARIYDRILERCAPSSFHILLAVSHKLTL